MSVVADLHQKARVYEMANGLPPLSVIDFIDELIDDGWEVRTPITSLCLLDRRVNNEP